MFQQRPEHLLFAAEPVQAEPPRKVSQLQSNYQSEPAVLLPFEAHKPVAESAVPVVAACRSVPVVQLPAEARRAEPAEPAEEY